MREHLRRFLIDHNFLRDRELEARDDELYEQGFETDDWSAWEAFCAERYAATRRVRWWVVRPCWGLGWPISSGGDEFNRHTTVIGFHFTGQLVVASRKPFCVHRDRRSGMAYVRFAQPVPMGRMRTVDSETGVLVDVDKDTGRVLGLEIFPQDSSS